MLDQAVLDKMRNDYGEETLVELIDDFKRIGRDSIDGLCKAAKADDQKSMTRYAHDLKSSSAVLGLMRLSEQSRKIELASNDGRLQEARSLSTNLEPSLAAAIDTLEGRS